MQLKGLLVDGGLFCPGLSRAPALPIGLLSPLGLSGQGLKGSEQPLPLCLGRGCSAPSTEASGSEGGPSYREAGALAIRVWGPAPPGRGLSRAQGPRAWPGGGRAGEGTPVWTSAFPQAHLSTPLWHRPRESRDVPGVTQRRSEPQGPPQWAGAGGQSLRAEVRVLRGHCLPAQLVNPHAGKGFHFLSLARSVLLLPRKSAGYGPLFGTFAMADNG